MEHPVGKSGLKYTDDARRMADTMNLHAIAKGRGWAVFSLADGRSPSLTAFETYTEALMSTKWNRDNFLYLEIPADGVQDPYEMQGCLDFARKAHKMGMRLPDPDDTHNAAHDFPFHTLPIDRVSWREQLRNITK